MLFAKYLMDCDNWGREYMIHCSDMAILGFFCAPPLQYCASKVKILRLSHRCSQFPNHLWLLLPLSPLLRGLLQWRNWSSKANGICSSRSSTSLPCDRYGFDKVLLIWDLEWVWASHHRSCQWFWYNSTSKLQGTWQILYFLWRMLFI